MKTVKMICCMIFFCILSLAHGKALLQNSDENEGHSIKDLPKEFSQNVPLLDVNDTIEGKPTFIPALQSQSEVTDEIKDAFLEKSSLKSQNLDNYETRSEHAKHVIAEKEILATTSQPQKLKFNTPKPAKTSGVSEATTETVSKDYEPAKASNQTSGKSNKSKHTTKLGHTDSLKNQSEYYEELDVIKPTKKSTDYETIGKNNIANDPEDSKYETPSITKSHGKGSANYSKPTQLLPDNSKKHQNSYDYEKIVGNVDSDLYSTMNKPVTKPTTQRYNEEREYDEPVVVETVPKHSNEKSGTKSSNYELLEKESTGKEKSIGVKVTEKTTDETNCTPKMKATTAEYNTDNYAQVGSTPSEIYNADQYDKPIVVKRVNKKKSNTNSDYYTKLQNAYTQHKETTGSYTQVATSFPDSKSEDVDIPKPIQSLTKGANKVDKNSQKVVVKHKENDASKKKHSNVTAVAATTESYNNTIKDIPKTTEIQSTYPNAGEKWDAAYGKKDGNSNLHIFSVKESADMKNEYDTVNTGKPDVKENIKGKHTEDLLQNYSSEEMDYDNAEIIDVPLSTNEDMDSVEVLLHSVKDSDLPNLDSVVNIQTGFEIKENGSGVSERLHSQEMHDLLNSEKLSRNFLTSLESNLWSLIFNPNAKAERLKKCLTRMNETGNCIYVQFCSVPNIASSLEQLLNNACVIDDVFIGVCCPEFPAETVKVDWDQALQKTSDSIDDEVHTFHDCGERSQAVVSRDWPWNVHLLSMANRIIFCGGVLINDKYILTAAHCTTKIPRNQILARLGQNSETGEDYAVIEIKRHAQYNPRTMHNDIALLKLARHVQLSEDIGLVCLPDDDAYVGKKSTLLGWSGISSTNMKKKDESLAIIPNRMCKDQLNVPVPDSVLCTEPRIEDDRTCNADSGAPLVVQDGKYKVVGILSWNRNDCDPRTPSTFGRVSYFREWIKKHIS